MKPAVAARPSSPGAGLLGASPATTLLYALLAAVLLTRSFLDPVLESTKVGGAKAIGFGAIINALMIAAAALLLIANYRVITPRDLLPWASFLSICIVGSLLTHDPVGVARFVLALVSTFAAFVVPLCLVRSVRDAGRLTDLILMSAVVPAAYGFVEIASNLGDPEFRAQSTFAHPNIFAFYIIIVMATLLLRWSSEELASGRLRRAAYVAAFAVLGVLLVYTKTRSAWFGAAAMLAVFAVFVDRRALPILVLVPALALLEPSIRERLMDASTATDYIGTGVVMNSYEWRKTLWAGAFGWILEQPFVGHGGLDSFYYYSTKFFPFVASYVDGVYAHSVFVQLLFELGVLGLLAFLAIIGHVLWRLVRLAARDRSAAIVGASLCIAYLGLCYSDNMLYYLSANWYLFLLLGILVAWSRLGPAPVPARAARAAARSPTVWEPLTARPSPFAGWRAAAGRASSPFNVRAR